MATYGNGDDGPPPNGGDGLPVHDLRTMEELCQPTLNGRGGPIAPTAIQANNFRLKNDMIQQVQNSCQFHGLPGDDLNKHLDKFLHVTQSIKVNEVTDDALRLTHHAAAWFDRLPRNSILSFDQMETKFLSKYFPPSTVTKLRNEITNFRQRPDKSLFEAWECYKLSIDQCPDHNMLPATQIDTFYNGLTLRHIDTINAAAGALKNEMTEMNKNFLRMLQNQQVNSVTPSCETCGGPHSYHKCQATDGNIQNVYAAGTYNQGGNTYQPQGSGTLPGNTITNPSEDLKVITTQSGVAYDGPTIPTTSSSPPKVVERESEVTKDTVPTIDKESTENVQPSVVQIFEPFFALVSAPKPNPKPLNPYPSRLNDQKLCEKANKQMKKFFQIFQDLNFNIIFADALIFMPKFASTIKSLLSNKEKLFELARTPLNEHCLMVLLKKLPKKLGDPGKSFLKTKRAFIDVYTGKLTLRVNDEAVTFNLDQTLRYSSKYDDISVNRIDVIDVACEEDSDFVLEETNAFLAVEDEPISPEINDSYYDSEGDILLLKEFLNDDPSSPPLPS
nr:reverse transcriptase domain-containing protein [Tanacetum cinerariifolium]